MRAEQKKNITEYTDLFQSDVEGGYYDWAELNFKKAEEALPQGHHPLATKLAKVSVRMIPCLIKAGQTDFARTVLEFAISATKDKKIKSQLKEELEGLAA